MDLLKSGYKGEFYADDMMRSLYATDASAYRELPQAVAIPKYEADIELLIRYAREKKTSLIPRTAGTSLAGQVVGNGIVVDVSKHQTKILELNLEERWVRVQPGVIRDELNLFLKPHGFLFGPETSTANRAMLGGMVGNNSCGSNSVIYGSTREHLLEVEAFLSDSSKVCFKALSAEEFQEKRNSANKLEARIYEHIWERLNDEEMRREILAEFPKPSITRRNTGYAVDELLNNAPFLGQDDFNFCRLLAGSEGTLAFVTEIKVNIEPLPAPEQGLLCLHFQSINEALRANIVAMQHQPGASELIDDYILDCTKDSLEYSQYRFFLEGAPKAILVVELRGHTRDEVQEKADTLIVELQQKQLGYAYPLLYGNDCNKVWALRKAGLGLLSNIPGDSKPAPVIEDTAVDVEDLPDYIADFDLILHKHGLTSVYYAHAGSGEIHLRPILNLKTSEGLRMFRVIAEEVAALVKKYRGSLSGEHGDGRLRGEFIRQMVGEKNYNLMCELKQVWDAEGIFNPGKIVHAPPMDTNLRFKVEQKIPVANTVFDFGEVNILQHVEQCNGSGDCRKRHFSGGTMCPSYMATRDEKDTTRARANILREFLTNSPNLNRFDHQEIYDVMDLCLACKGCKSECPSGVDVAKVKMEFLQHYYDANGVPLRAKMIANYSKMNRVASLAPGVFNFAMSNALTGPLIKKSSGFAVERSLPALYKHTLLQWWRKHQPEVATPSRGKVFLFCDEFTNYNDVEIGMTTVRLLERLGYEVVIPTHIESGRAILSKGLLRQAKPIAEKNVALLHPLVTEETPLVGIEPSAILTFRDEYPDLLRGEQQQQARDIAKHSFLLEEFLAREIDKGRIESSQFTSASQKVLLHGHCQQKALCGTGPTQKVLSLPENYSVEVIPSGCCGMAGSFGYEKEHYELSMQIGDLVLFPAVKKAEENTLLAAPGTSCRHQIKDGTGKKALHPAEILWRALV